MPPEDHVTQGGPPVESVQKPDDALLAAFDAGMENGKDDDPPPPDDMPEPAVDAAPESDPKPVDSEGTPTGDEPAKPEGDEPPKPEKADEPGEAKPPVAEPPKDKFDEPLPASTPKKTSERFDELRAEYRAVTAERDRYRDDMAAFEKTLVDYKITPEQYGSTIGYLRLVNEGSPEALREAHAKLSAELTALSKAIGVEAPGFDPLEAHADLREEVESGDITRARALELAQARQRDNLAAAHQQQASTQTDAQKAVAAAKDEIAELGATLRAADPHFAVKTPALKAAINAITEGFPPSEWRRRIEAAYREIPAPAIAPTPARSAPASIRPGTAGTGGNGGMSKAPGNVHEAAEAAFASFGR